MFSRIIAWVSTRGKPNKRVRFYFGGREVGGDSKIRYTYTLPANTIDPNGDDVTVTIIEGE